MLAEAMLASGDVGSAAPNRAVPMGRPGCSHLQHASRTSTRVAGVQPWIVLSSGDAHTFAAAVAQEDMPCSNELDP